MCKANQSDQAGQWILRRTIVIAALLAALIVVAAGVGIYLLNPSKSGWNVRNASVAAFVGSETCAGCHQAQAELWHTSQHKHAMDYAT